MPVLAVELVAGGLGSPPLEVECCRLDWVWSCGSEPGAPDVDEFPRKMAESGRLLVDDVSIEV